MLFLLLSAAQPRNIKFLATSSLRNFGSIILGGNFLSLMLLDMLARPFSKTLGDSLLLNEGMNAQTKTLEALLSAEGWQFGWESLGS